MLYDISLAPAGAIQVSEPPSDYSLVWNGSAWVKVIVLKSTVMARIITAGLMSQAYQGLVQQPVLFARWFSPDYPEVKCNDPDAISFVKALGLDPNVILAP